MQKQHIASTWYHKFQFLHKQKNDADFSFYGLNHRHQKRLELIRKVTRNGGCREVSTTFFSTMEENLGVNSTNRPAHNDCPKNWNTEAYQIWKMNQNLNNDPNYKRKNHNKELCIKKWQKHWQLLPKQMIHCKRPFALSHPTSFRLISVIKVKDLYDINENINTSS